MHIYIKQFLNCFILYSTIKYFYHKNDNSSIKCHVQIGNANIQMSLSSDSKQQLLRMQLEYIPMCFMGLGWRQGKGLGSWEGQKV